ncbi:MAG TPA: phospholipase D family protein [Chitinophagales bacterium]|nr:phospholipase D family protein [Chitinophagales bacterium]
MKLIGTTTELTKEFKRLMLNYDQYLWTVAWADFNFEMSNLLVIKKAKIIKICVGLQFFGTHLGFLEKFYNHQGVRFIDQTKGTYHPKLYLFTNSATDWELLIGSANYTSSAFTNNTEASVLISSADKSESDFYKSIVLFIDEQWSKGKILTKEYVKEYTKRKKKVKTYVPKLPLKGIRQPVYEKTWKEYLTELKQEDYKGSIRFLDWVKNEFSKQEQFHKINLQTRKSIAGFGSGEKEEHGVDIGCFGTTNARGYFKNSVIEKPEIITNALSKIPKKGEVTKSDYLNFIKEFQKVSSQKELACASRMLCLWRPDYFINFNGKNQNAMCKELQINKSKVNYETYWDLIVEPFINSDWSKQNKSMQKSELKIYNYRVALLDCIYYKWD